MTSMEAVIELINRAGPEAHLVKQDWADGKAMLQFLRFTNSKTFS